MIDGVAIHKLKVIKADRGQIMHMMRSDSDHFSKFGEIYFSQVFPGRIKAWHIHREMTLNYAVPVGRITMVLYDDREGSSTKGELMEIELGDENYSLVTVPPGVWNGFVGKGNMPALVANCADLPHDPEEISRMDAFDKSIPYEWKTDYISPVSHG